MENTEEAGVKNESQSLTQVTKSMEMPFMQTGNTGDSLGESHGFTMDWLSL